MMKGILLATAVCIPAILFSQVVSEDTIVAPTVLVDLGLNIQKEEENLNFAKSRTSVIHYTESQTDVLRILQGKISGMEIMQSNGLNGSSTSSIIRGMTFAEGSNQPLVIVDGMPFDSRQYTQLSPVEGSANSSTRLLDLDPQNISSIRVIKGLSGTVLYGQQGKNGVILIETKGKRFSEKLSIEASQGLGITEISNLPDYQYSYGSGFNNAFGWTFSSWGAPYGISDSLGIDVNGSTAHPYDIPFYTQDLPEYIGQRYEYRPYKSIPSFYRKGMFSNTFVQAQIPFGNKWKTSINFSRYSNSGILPLDKNELIRNSVGGSLQVEATEKWKFSGSFNLSDLQKSTPPSSFASGSNPNGPSLFSNLLYTPSNIDLQKLPFENPDTNLMLYYRRANPIQNPVWGLNYMTDTENVNRSWSYISGSYTSSDKLTFAFRVNYDHFRSEEERKINARSSQVPNGQYLTTRYTLNSLSQTYTVSYSPNISKDIDLMFFSGADIQLRRLQSLYTERSGQSDFGVFTNSNFADIGEIYRESISNSLSPFTDISVGFKDVAEGNLVYRADIRNTDDASLLFSSIGGSIGIKPFNYPGILSPQWSKGIKLRTGFAHMSLPSEDLDPERLSEWEIGVDWNWNNLSVTLGWYSRTLKDAVVFSSFNPFFQGQFNGAEIRNRGIEIALNYSKNLSENLMITSSVRYFQPENIVISTSPASQEIYLENFIYNGLFSVLVPGEEFGSYYGSRFARFEGSFVMDEDGSWGSEGFPSVLGNPTPDFILDFQLSLRWRSLQIGLLTSYSQGGEIISETATALLGRGVTTDTESNRYIPFYKEGVTFNNFGDPSLFDYQVMPYEAYFNAAFTSNEGSLFDATFFRVREISISWDWTGIIGKSLPLNSLEIALFARNPFHKAYGFSKGLNYDPGINSMGISNIRGLDFITGPATRSYGIGLSIKI